MLFVSDHGPPRRSSRGFGIPSGRSALLDHRTRSTPAHHEVVMRTHVHTVMRTHVHRGIATPAGEVLKGDWRLSQGDVSTRARGQPKRTSHVPGRCRLAASGPSGPRQPHKEPNEPRLRCGSRAQMPSALWRYWFAASAFEEVVQCGGERGLSVHGSEAPSRCKRRPLVVRWLRAGRVGCEA